MTLAVAAPLLCVFAFLMAAVEIEIEGPYGWAQNLPTPYRVSGPLARAFGTALGGKPLTGYNLLMFTATLVAFHLPFAFGTEWTAVTELSVLAAWVAWSALWDFLWFLLNPAYGWRLFLPGSVWWHARWLWRLPVDYWVATGASLVLALVAQMLAWGGADAASPGPFAGQVLLLVAFVAWAVVVGLASPLYARVYRHTHAAGFDERGSVAITPPPGASPRSAEADGDADELPWQE
jgi:hypothetical protein